MTTCRGRGGTVLCGSVRPQFLRTARLATLAADLFLIPTTAARREDVKAGHIDGRVQISSTPFAVAGDGRSEQAQVVPAVPLPTP